MPAGPGTVTGPDTGHVTAVGGASAASPVGRGFIALYLVALIGIWVALLTPVIEGLTLRIGALVPAARVSGDLSHVTLVGAVCALIGNAFWGRLSDRTTSRLGKRRPWMVVGMTGGTTGLAIIVVAHSILLVAVGWCIAQLFYNAALSALVATVPDRVPVGQRGLITGLVGAALPAGLVIGTYIVKAVNPSIPGMVLLPAGIGLVGVLAFAAFLTDRPAVGDALPRYTVATFLDTFWVNPVKHRDFAWAWFSRLWIWLGIATFAIYQVLYLEVRLYKSPVDIPNLVLTITLIGSSAVLIASVIGGRLSDILARRKAFVLISGLLYAAGLLVIATSHSWGTYLVGVGIHGVGEGLFLGVDLALANDVLPSPETAAHDLGVLNIANALPQALAPTFGPVLLAINGPNDYVAVPLACAVFCVIGALTILPVRRVR
jgi:MFS family permease